MPRHKRHLSKEKPGRRPARCSFAFGGAHGPQTIIPAAQSMTNRSAQENSLTDQQKAKGEFLGS